MNVWALAASVRTQHTFIPGSAERLGPPACPDPLEKLAKDMPAMQR